MKNPHDSELRSPVFDRGNKKSNYGNPADDLTALAEHKINRNLVFASRRWRTTRRYKVARTLI